MVIFKMKKLRIAESNIPVIEYDNTWDCVLDKSLETKKYLQSFDLPKNKYDGEFAFIYKVKGMKDIFLVINCFLSSILIESIGIFDDFEDENASLNEVICRSFYNLKKVVLSIKKYENRELLSMRDFKFLYRSLKKSYKKQIVIGALAVCVIGGALTFATTRAKYKLTEEIEIAKGTINYKPYDFKYTT